MSNKRPPKAPLNRFIASLIVLSAISIGLLGTRIIFSDSSRYGFLLWNLCLAIIPAVLSWWLVKRIQASGWLNWQQVALTVLWIVFLPNSFYLITDLIHLRTNYEADPLFDISLLISFIFAGVIFGFIGVYLVHREIVKRLRERYTYGLLSVLFLAVSFAICLGRYTRWNTWDILLKPAGLLFDVSDRFINPIVHAQTYQSTVTLFLLLFSTYAVVWEATRLLRAK